MQNFILNLITQFYTDLVSNMRLQNSRTHHVYLMYFTITIEIPPCC